MRISKLFIVIVLVLSAAGLVALRRAFEPQPGVEAQAASHPSAQLGAVPPVANPAATSAADTPGPGAVSAPAAAPAKVDPLAGFDGWTERFQKADVGPAREALLLDGLQLARERREALTRLIRSNPKRALEQAIPYRVRRVLPSEIVALLEQPVEGRGRLDVLGVVPGRGRKIEEPIRRSFSLKGTAYRAYVYGHRLHLRSQTGLAVHGIAVDEFLAIHETPARVLEPEEAADLSAAGRQPAAVRCVICGKEESPEEPMTWVALGGEFMAACRPAHAREYVSSLTEAEKNLNRGRPARSGDRAGIPVKDGTGSISQGTKTLLYIRVCFPDDPTEPITESEAYQVMKEVNDFYEASSYHSTAIITTVGPLVTLPQPKRWYGDTDALGTLMDHAREATRAAGFDYRNYDWELIRHGVVPGWEDWAGMGFIGARGVWLQDSSASVAAHELGHNYGLIHANFWITTRPFYPDLPRQPPQFPAAHDQLAYAAPPLNNAIPWDVDSLVGREWVIGPGDEDEYGDRFDNMGSGGFPDAHFGAVGKWKLDWLPESSIRWVTQSRTNRLYAFDQPDLIPGGTHALVIAKNSEIDYWVSVRSRIANNRWVNNGVLLHWESQTAIGGDSVLLDTTPGTRQLRTDSALVVGRTFTDPEAQIHITPVARGVEGNTPWVDVVVQLGTSASNLPPTVELQAPSLRAQPDQPLQFTAEVLDPNGDAVAYAWDFGDDSFGMNSPSVTKSWSAAGEYVVRCEVSDMRGGVTSLHRVVTIGSPPTLRISGRVLDQYGLPLPGVRVHNGALADAMTIETNTHVFTFTDSEGRYSLVNLASSNSFTCGAYLRGYVTRPHNFLNPVNLVDVSAQNVDYLAQLIPLVTVVPATPAAEAGLQSGAFTVSRTGPTNTVLVIPLTTAGTAEEGVDYETLPDVDFSQVLTNILTDPDGNQLTNVYTNTITAPHAVLLLEGVRSTNVIIRPLTDTTYETTEWVSLDLGRQERAVRDTNFFDPDINVPGWDIVTTAGQSVWMLAEPDYYTGSPALARLPLTDDDPPANVAVSLAVLDGVAIENPNDIAAFVVSRDRAFSDPLAVSYSLAGSAVNGADYLALSGTITIPAGERSAYLTILPIDDLYVEGTESVEVTLQAGTGYTLASTGPVTASIVDSDLPTVTIVATDNLAAEPGSDVGQVTITRYGDLSRDLDVSYFVEGTATSGRDFAPLPGRVTIPAGAVSASVTLTPREDPLVEDDEVVTLFLADSATYNIGNPASADVIILDNELPFLSITATDDAAAEPSDTAELRVVRTGSTAQPLSVLLGIYGTAIPNADVAAIPNPVYVPAGASQVTLTVTPIDDAFREIPEDLFVEVLPDPSYNLGPDPVARVTISDDDSGNQPAVGFTLLSSQGLESVTTVHFSVSVSDYPGQDQGVTNLVYLVPGTATESLDFEPFSSNLVVFPPGGPLVQDFTVTVKDDDLVEAPEIFSLVLTDLPPSITYAFETNVIEDPDNPENSVTNITITTNITVPPVFAVYDVYRIHTYTILDNDANIVTVTATDPLASETGPKAGLLSFIREGPTNSSLTFRFQVTGTASSGSDFEPLGTQLTFPAGVSQLDLRVVPLDDPVVETTETIQITLISAEKGQIGTPGSAELALEDNDGAIEFSALAYRAREDVGEVVATVRRSGDLSSPTRVDYVTMPGTADPGNDYAPTNGTIQFAAGENVQTIRIPIVDDSLVEPEETFGLLLVNPAGGAPLGGQNTAQVLIGDNDTSLDFVFAGFSVNESGTNALITVRRSGLTDFEVSVGYVATNGTAIAEADFQSRTGTLTFSTGQTNATFSIPLLDDILMEGDETVVLLLTNASAGAVLGPQATASLVLVDDECAIEFDAPAYSLLEYAGAASVVVRRVGGTVNPVSATYTTTNETALAGRTEDYRAEAGTLQFAGDAWVPVPNDPGTLVFQKGETNKTITIPINDDTLGERNETFGVRLTQVRGPTQGALPGSAVLGSTTNTTVTILDNESPGHVDYEFNPGLGADGPVYAVGLEPDDQVLLGGDFTTVDGVFIGRVARLHPDGYLDFSFNPGAGPDGPVLAVTWAPGGRIYLGGAFNRINQVPRRGLARLNEDGTLDDTFTTATDDAVRAFAVQTNGMVLLGGEFNAVGGFPRGRVARLNTDGQVDLTFAPSGGVGGTVFALAAQPDGKVVIAGDFSTVNGQACSRVARLQADGSVDPSFAATPDGPVRSLALEADGKVLIAGAFGNVGAAPRAGVARLNPDGSLDTTFIPGSGANDLVRSVAVCPGGRIIVGGDFTLFNGQVLNRFARLNSDGTVDLTFDVGSGANGAVHAAVAQADTATVIGGEFTQVRDVARNRIARIHGEEAFSSGIIQFSAATYTMAEEAGFVLISVFRTGNTKDTMVVDFNTADGTATAGADYEANSGTLTFAPGETLKTFQVVIFDDTIGEGNETITLNLVAAGTATLVIVDDESAVAFSSPTYEVSETAGSAVITVKRTGSSTDSFSVDFTVGPGTATADADFVAAGGTLTFAPGESDKTFSVVVLQDEEVEDGETILLTLLNPTGGVALGSQRTALLTIRSEDQAQTSFFLNITPPLGGTVTPPSGAYPTNSIQTVIAVPALHFEFVRWEGSIVSDANPLVLIMTQDYNLTARFRPTQPTYTFEPPFADSELTVLPWATTPNAPWRLQTATAASGEVAVRSGLIADNQQSILDLGVETLAGTASFDVRVSTEVNWDFLEFYLNGVRLQRWSGEVDWRPYLFSVPAGANHLQWRLVKDANFSSGLDAVFIDNLYVPIDTPVPPDAAARLSIQMAADGVAQIGLSGKAGYPYVLESSPDLSNWTGISTNVVYSGMVLISDPQSTNHPCLYYRAVAR